MRGMGGTRRLGGFPIISAGYDSYNAYGTDKFERTVASGAGSVVAGSFGSFTANATCNLVFGFETGGTSLFWCALIAGAPAGMSLSFIGGKSSGKLYDLIAAPSATDVIMTSDQFRVHRLSN